MSTTSGIEWTDGTWNFVVGCSPVSSGCAHCYAVRDAHRLGHNPHPRIQAAYGGLTRRLSNGKLAWTGTVRFLPERLRLPLRVQTPQRFFVNSESDLFHEHVATRHLCAAFAVMREASWHTFQILTKRSERLHELDAQLVWPPNVWMGVSVENNAARHRITDLQRSGARVKFLSIEPLLEPLPDLDLDGIDWVIVGGESGPGARPMQESWVTDLRDQCDRAGVAFFFKQWGGVHKKKTGRILDGRTYDDFPILD